MAPTPLAVVGVTTALLVVVVGADLVVNREFYLDAKTEGGWTTIGTTFQSERPFYSEPEALRVNRSDTVSFRLRVANDVPVAFDEVYKVREGAITRSEGRLRADPASEGITEFTIMGSELIDRGGGDPYPVERAKFTEGFGSFDVTVGPRQFGAGIRVVEVER